MQCIEYEKHLNAEFSHHKSVVENFFENYPETQWKQRLWRFYKGFMFYCEHEMNGAFCFEDLTFFEKTIAVLGSFNQIQNRFSRTITENNDLPDAFSKCPENLKPLIYFITSVVPIEYVYCFSQTEHSIDLMIVLDRNCVQPFSELEPVLSLASLGFPTVECSLHVYSKMMDLLQKGHVFYSYACAEQHLVYVKPESLLLPTVSMETYQKIVEEAKQKFDVNIERAIQFYKGAQICIDEGSYCMAAFMLQQACELTYRTLLLVLRGKDIKCHALTVLRKHVRRFAKGIIGVFSIDEEQEQCYLGLFEDAYVKARYEQDYSIAEKDLLFFMQGVGRLQEKAVDVIHNYLGLQPI